MAKLSQIVSYFLDSENYGDQEEARAYRFAIRCLQTEVQLDIQGKVNTHTITIGKDRIAILPKNCIKVKHLDYAIDYSNVLNNNYSFMSDIQFEQHIKKLKPPYTVDYKKRQIVFDADYPDDSIDIKSLDREELCGDTDLDERLSNMIVAYIKWQWEMGRKGNGAGQINYFKTEYYREKTNCKFRIGRPSTQELNFDARAHTYYGVKE